MPKNKKSNKVKEQHQPRNAKADKAARKNRKKGINPDAHKANPVQQVNRKGSKRPTPDPLPGSSPSVREQTGKKKTVKKKTPHLTPAQVAAHRAVAMRPAALPVMYLDCIDCVANGREQVRFPYSGAQQLRHAKNNWEPPIRCPECRGLKAKAKRDSLKAAERPSEEEKTPAPSSALADMAAAAVADPWTDFHGPEGVECKVERGAVSRRPSAGDNPGPGPAPDEGGDRLPALVEESDSDTDSESDSGGEEDAGGEEKGAEEKENHGLAAYHFEAYRFPLEQAPNSHNPSSRAREAASALDILAMQVQDAFTDTKNADCGIEFGIVPVPTDLVRDIKFACKTIPKTNERKRVISLSAGRKVKDYERKVEKDTDFWDCLREWDPANAHGWRLVDKSTYFGQVEQAMEWYATVSNPLISTTTEQAYRQTESKRQAAIAFNQGEAERWRHVRALGAACTQNKQSILGAALFCASASPSTTWSLLKGTLDVAGSLAVTTAGLLCNSLALLGLCCICYERSESCRCAAHRVWEPIRDRAEPIIGPSLRRVARGLKRLRDGTCLDGPDDDGNDPPPDEGGGRGGPPPNDNGGNDTSDDDDEKDDPREPLVRVRPDRPRPRPARRHSDPGVELADLGDRRAAKRQRVEEQPGRGAADAPECALLGPPPAPKPREDGGGLEAKTDEGREVKIPEGALGDQPLWPLPGLIDHADRLAELRQPIPRPERTRWYMGEHKHHHHPDVEMQTLMAGNPDTGEVAPRTVRSNPGGPQGKDAGTPNFSKPAGAFPERPSGCDDLGPPGYARAELAGVELLLHAYTGLDASDLKYEFVEVQQLPMGNEDILEFREAGGEYRTTYSTFVMNEPAPYRNPDICPHIDGVACQMDLPPDARELGPTAFIDQAFRDSWNGEMKARAEDRFARVRAASSENDVLNVVRSDLPFKSWWITGPLLWQSPPMAYEASVHNFCFGMKRHYGTKPRACACDPEPNTPIADYAHVGTCEMCVAWEEARVAMLPWSSTLPHKANAYLQHQDRLGEPVDVLHHVEAIALGEPIPKRSPADDQFGFASWYMGLDSTRRGIYGPGINDLLEGRFAPYTFSMTAFIKWEKATQNLPNGKSKRLKAPRLVCPSKHPQANLVSGPVFKAVSKALTWDSQAWLRAHSQPTPWVAPAEVQKETQDLEPPQIPPVVITSGMSPRGVGAVFGEWQKESCIAIEFDFSALDSSENKQYARVVYPILALIISLACNVLHLEALNFLFISMSHRWMYTPFGRFLYIWGLCSGFGGTYHINSIGVTIAICGRLWVRLKAELTRVQGSPPTGGIFDYIRYIGLGDDGLVGIRGVSRKVVSVVKQQVVEDLKVMGLNPTPVHSAIPSFCSALFWPIVVDGHETYVLGPEILRALSRFGATYNHSKPTCTRVQGLAYCKGTVLSNMHWKGIPILRVLWDYYSGVDVEADVTQLEEHKGYECDPTVKYSKSVKTNLFIKTAYGLDLEEVHLLESELHSALVLSRGGPCFFSSPLLHAMASHHERVREHDVLPPP